MQRKAYVPGLAALLVALVTGCTAGTGTEGSATDSKPGGPSSSVAPPGKYRTLEEACGSVERSTLRDLLPGVAQLPEEQQEQVYEGTSSITYDTDRRVGCRWKGQAPDASHQLKVDFERVVSYDTAVSDEDRAAEVFAKKQAAASPPIAEASGDDEGTQSPSVGGTATTAPTGASSSPKTTESAEGAASTESADGTGTPTETDNPGSSGIPGAPDGLEPRLLEDLGDAAFLDDVLARAGSTAQQRTVSVVFRTSNVIVTIVYSEQPARTTEVPDSKELQEKARSLARKLDERINE